MSPRPTPQQRRSRLREAPVLLVTAVCLALLARTFLVQAFYIPSGSMERTLHGCPGCRGDRILVDKLVPDVRSIRRGDIVVFDGEGSFGTDDGRAPRGLLADGARGLPDPLGLAAGGGRDYVKRVIAVGGDRVACCSPAGHVTVQPAGSPTPVELHEPYVHRDDDQAFCAAGTGRVLCPPGAEGVLVPDGRLWVMGDHRSGSSDSRAHLSGPDRGTVAEDRVIGRAFVIVWPPARAGLLPVPRTFDAFR